MNGLTIRERTPIWLMIYSVYLYFCSTSLRKASKALEIWIKRSHTAIWNWVQRLSSLADRFKPGGVECVLIDETQIKIGDKEAWVWLAFEPYRKAFLGFHISFTRNSLDAWIFLKRLRRRYGFKPIYTNGGPWYHLAWKELYEP
ncbi:MAG: DDE-type integrase/transposase/recombinase [Candidatus Bathyarchaeia archaeon]